MVVTHDSNMCVCVCVCAMWMWMCVDLVYGCVCVWCACVCMCVHVRACVCMCMHVCGCGSAHVPFARVPSSLWALHHPGQAASSSGACATPREAAGYERPPRKRDSLPAPALRHTVWRIYRTGRRQPSKRARVLAEPGCRSGHPGRLRRGRRCAPPSAHPVCCVLCGVCYLVCIVWCVFVVCSVICVVCFVFCVVCCVLCGVMCVV
jgi:hypothetical protein